MSELHCDSGFQQLLAQHFSIVMLEQHPGTVYGLWPDLTLAYMNPAWFDFARDNQGEPAISHDWRRGRSVAEALPDVLHPYYVELYLRALENDSDQPLQHDYECSSPRQHRLFEMSLHNLGFGAGLLIINHERQVGDHNRPAQQAEEQQYRDERGRYRQCSHCRCYQNLQQRTNWDWIPTWLTTPPADPEHTLCPTCFNHYYSLSN